MSATPSTNPYSILQNIPSVVRYSTYLDLCYEYLTQYDTVGLKKTLQNYTKLGTSINHLH